MRGGRAKPRRAFTLGDLVITVLIIGIMAAITAPKFNDALESYRAEAAATRIVADLQYARQHARSTSSTETVSFDVANARYAFSSAPNLERPSQVQSADLNKLFDSTIVSAAFGSDAQVTFNAYGVPDSSGTISVQSGPYSRTVVLDADTGHAHIQ